MFWMKKKRFSVEQIVGVLKQAQVGVPVAEVTVDASSSTVIKHSPLGRKLMTITVGEQPDNGSPFNGTTDIAFGLKRASLHHR